MLSRVSHLPIVMAAAALLVLALSLTIERQAEAVGAVENLSGCTSSSLPANDDGSTSAVPLAFSPNFFGTTYNQIFVNNNGNVTFDSGLSQFTADSLLSVSRVIIAPFWADVDTRGASNTVSYGPVQFSGRPAFCVNWVNVGYFSQNTDKLNSFQLIIVDRSDVGAGDFDMIFNFDKIQWETGDLSGGTNGFGGSSARMGYSNGSNQAFEYPGSAVNGALLDATPSGLSRNSLNSTVTGRYIFSVRGGVPPGSGSITGTIFGPPPAGGSSIAGNGLQPLANSTVTACAVPPCSTTISNDNGEFTLAGLDDGLYRIIAYPPPGRDNLLPADVSINVSGGPADVGQLDMDEPIPTPPGSSIDSIGSIGGAPVLDWSRPSDFSVVGCEGGSGTWTVTDSDGFVLAFGTFSQSPLGQYNGTIPPLSPYHGPASVNVSITNCPDAAENSDFGFSIYIDPSGHVLTVQGAPIPGATVTLRRADTAAGPFTIVPNGSNIMSPSNRTNPDTTDSDGFFHWDTIAGHYIVRAEFAGCHKPGDPGTPYNETPALPVPPPQLNLEIRLDCGEPAQEEIWGDVNCSGGSPNPIDSLRILRNDAGLSSVSVQGTTCPAIGAQLVVNAVLRIWGDLDCSGGPPGPIDSLKTLRSDAGLSVSKVDATCPNAGSTVTLGAAATPAPTPTVAAATQTPVATPSPTATASPETSCPGNFLPLVIPDNDPGNPAVLELTNAGGGVITDLDICLNINHGWVGDLFVEVEHIDTGTTVTLIDQPGLPALGTFGCSGAHIRALMDDEAAGPIEDECTLATPSIVGAFRPNEPLSAFDGEVFAGDWEIRFSDKAALSTGSVVGATFTWLESGGGTPPPTLPPLPTPPPTLPPLPTPAPTNVGFCWIPIIADGGVNGFSSFATCSSFGEPSYTCTAIGFFISCNTFSFDSPDYSCNVIGFFISCNTFSFDSPDYSCNVIGSFVSCNTFSFDSPDYSCNVIGSFISCSTFSIDWPDYSCNVIGGSYFC